MKRVQQIYKIFLLNFNVFTLITKIRNYIF